VQAEIVSIEVDNGAVSAVRTQLGEVWSCKAAVICTGTYLDSRIFVGNVNYESGPDGFLASRGLSASLASLGVKLMRFKTGTPSRVNRRSIDFSVLERQDGEETITPYSYKTDDAFFDENQQLPCHIVYTNAETHRIIRENINRSAMYSGQIHGTGPRYCPSIEDKLTRFADKERHQLFVEPVGADTEEMYIQGFSTSLPVDVQRDMLHSLDGFENAEIMRYAYAIEYDCIDPTELYASLEFKAIKGLYGAGQFNGTSGYEEAAAQGLIAGLNASLALRGKEPLILSRSESYIGTLIDDLVTKGTNEPYRMMTSRSEYRLLLRQDNADARLTRKGYEAGLVSEEQYQAFLKKQAQVEQEIERLKTTHISPLVLNPFLKEHGLAEVNSGFSLADLLRRPEISYEMLAPLDKNRPSLPPRVLLTVEVSVKYEGYIKRQIAEVERHARLEVKTLPEDLDYLSIKGLRTEAAQKLAKIKPLTIGQASRISGVNPADVSVLLIYLGLK
jgi:tRNA uridine 5-carboxymethylaminomethyl modification enzyme